MPLFVGVGGNEVEKHVASMHDDKCLRYGFPGLVAHGSCDNEATFFPQRDINVIDAWRFAESNQLGIASRKSARIVDGGQALPFFAACQSIAMI